MQVADGAAAGTCIKCGQVFQVVGGAAMLAMASAPPRRSRWRRRDRFGDGDWDQGPAPAAEGDASTALGFGIAGIITGFIALIVSFIPCVGAIGLLVAGLGLLLTGGGFLSSAMNRWRGWGMPVAGAVVNVLALLIACSWLYFIDSWITTSRESAAHRQRQWQQPAPNWDPGDNGPGFPQPAGQALPEWVDVSQKEAVNGDVRLVVTKVRIGLVEYKDATKDEPLKARCLAIHLRLENQSATQKYEYWGWGNAGPFPSPNAGTLRDDLNQVRPHKQWAGFITVPGQVRAGTVQPGGTLEDMLTFEEPVRDFAYLRLDLPSQAFSWGPPRFRLHIPKAMVVFD
jgi:hypothetical protein